MKFLVVLPVIHLVRTCSVQPPSAGGTSIQNEFSSGFEKIVGDLLEFNRGICEKAELTIKVDHGTETIAIPLRPSFSGSAGSIFLSDKYAIKVSAIKKEPRRQTLVESKILKAFGGLSGKVVRSFVVETALDSVCLEGIIVMEKVGQNSLAGQTFDEGTVAKIAFRALDILRGIHATGFVHGDIHSGNFVYETDPASFKVIDFGRSEPFLDKDGKHLEKSGKTYHESIRAVVLSTFELEGSKLTRRDDMYRLSEMFFGLLGAELPDEIMNVWKPRIALVIDLKKNWRINLGKCLEVWNTFHDEMLKMDFGQRPNYEGWIAVFKSLGEGNCPQTVTVGKSAYQDVFPDAKLELIEGFGDIKNSQLGLEEECPTNFGPLPDSSTFSLIKSTSVKSRFPDERFYSVYARKYPDFLLERHTVSPFDKPICKSRIVVLKKPPGSLTLLEFMDRKVLNEIDVARIAFRAVSIIKKIHGVGIFHGNIQEKSFLYIGNSFSEMKILDFSSSGPFVDTSDTSHLQHIHQAYRSAIALPQGGLAKYSSIFLIRESAEFPNGVEPSRRDDVYRLSEMLLRLLGSTPTGEAKWEKDRAESLDAYSSRMYTLKKGKWTFGAPSPTCKSIWQEFHAQMGNLKFTDKPNYDEWISAFKQLALMPPNAGKWGTMGPGTSSETSWSNWMDQIAGGIVFPSVSSPWGHKSSTYFPTASLRRDSRPPHLGPEPIAAAGT
jgi:serine/threonine protein kinase